MNRTFSIPLQSLVPAQRYAAKGETAPLPLDRFVGDNSNGNLRWLSERRAAIPDHFFPLVFFGEPGVGKTRIAESVASRLIDTQSTQEIPYSLSSVWSVTEEQRAGNKSLAQRGDSLTLEQRPSQVALSQKDVASGRTSSSRPFGWSPRAMRLPATEFRRRFRQALDADLLVEFRRELTALHVLILDDLEQLNNSPQTQHELLWLVNRFNASGRKLIFTMRPSPVTCRGLLPQLVSRLTDGLALRLDFPGESARRDLIIAFAACLNCQVEPSAVEFLSQQLTTSAREIYQSFEQIAKYSWSRQRNEAGFGDSMGDAWPTSYESRTQSGLVDDQAHSKPAASPVSPTGSTYFADRTPLITLDSVQAYWSRQSRCPNVDISGIESIVASEFSVKTRDLRSATRRQRIVDARGVAMYLARRVLGLSYQKIGRYFGNRDHSTVRHAIGQVNNRMRDDASFASLLQQLAIRCRQAGPHD